MSSAKKILPLSFGILAVVLIIISKIIEVTSGEKTYLIAWGASGSVAISILLYRFSSDNSEKFCQRIKDTNILSSQKLNPMRFLNFLTLAICIGLVATVVIYYNFILGMVIYLLMQLSLIFAFSGIFSINIIQNILQNDSRKLRKITIISLTFWILTILLVYLLFVYSGSDSLIVVPYVIALGTMAHYTWYGVAYDRRPFWFRFLLPLASMIFVFSDALIGNNVYGVNKLPDNIYLLIDITYVLNIFFMTQSVGFLNGNNLR